MSISRPSWRTILSTIGAFVGICSVLGMLSKAVWRMGMIDDGVNDLARRMGLAETQLTKLNDQVGALRVAVVRLQDMRHANNRPVPSNLFAAEPQAPQRPLSSMTYSGGGGN